MSIHIHTEIRYVVECENCGRKSKHVFEGHSDVEEARVYALEHGWDLGLMDMCSQCVHDFSPHWRQHVDALNAARIEAGKYDLVHRVYRCKKCGLWTYSVGLDDE